MNKREPAARLYRSAIDLAADVISAVRNKPFELTIYGIEREHYFNKWRGGSVVCVRRFRTLFFARRALRRICISAPAALVFWGYIRLEAPRVRRRLLPWPTPNQSPESDPAARKDENMRTDPGRNYFS